MPALTVAQNFLLGSSRARARGPTCAAARRHCSRRRDRPSRLIGASTTSRSPSARWSRSPRRCAASRGCCSSTSRRRHSAATAIDWFCGLLGAPARAGDDARVHHPSARRGAGICDFGSRCFATARPSVGTVSEADDDEVVRLMIGRDDAAGVPRPPPARRPPGRAAAPAGSRTAGVRGRRSRAARGRDRRRRRPRRPGPARALPTLFGVLAATRRGAGRRRAGADPARRATRSTRASGSRWCPRTARPRACCSRCRARRQPDAAVARPAGQPAAGSRGPRARDGCRRPAAQPRSRVRRGAGRVALRRQPAEGRDRQMAAGRPAHHPALRPDARRRRRHQARDLQADAAGSPTRAARCCSTRATCPS